MKLSKIDKMLMRAELGGKEWKKDDKHRIYFNRTAELYGLKADFYKSGSIRNAWLNGEKISNTQARGIIYQLQEGKVWYDVTAEEYHTRGIEVEIAQAIIAKITAMVANRDA